MKWEHRVMVHEKIGVTGTTVYDSHGEDKRIGGSGLGGNIGKAGKAITELLDRAGADGWELVSESWSSDKEGSRWYIFKRPVPTV